MNWTEISVLTTSEAVEAVANLLMNHGASGVQIDDEKDYEKLRGQDWESQGEILNVDEIPHIDAGAKVTAYFPETVFVSDSCQKLKLKWPSYNSSVSKLVRGL